MNTPRDAQQRPPRLDPRRIETRTDLAEALTALREARGLSIRAVVADQSRLGTVSGWFSGEHAPGLHAIGAMSSPSDAKSAAKPSLYESVLRACGVPDEELPDWFDAAHRARKGGRRSSGTVPYRGLRAFDVADSSFFFGRDDVADMLADSVRESGLELRPIIVTGVSGSGKSSLVRAGLLPRLGDRTSAVITPGDDPDAGLAALDPMPTVLVVDQLEELWTLVDEAERRTAFLDRLAALAASGTTIVAVLRADFYDRAARHPFLLAGLNSGHNLLGPLDDAGLRKVITTPAARQGVTVEPPLVDLLVEEFHSHDPDDTDAGALPLLSHTLLQLWQRSVGSKITVADYHATGGLRRAIETTAEGAYAALEPAQQTAITRILLRLVVVTNTADARRAAPRSELTWPDLREDDLDEAIAVFAAERLLTITDGPRALDADESAPPASSITISHEAILRAWPRLRTWIDLGRGWLLVHRAIADRARGWHEGGRDPEDLLSTGRLDFYDQWTASDAADSRRLTTTEVEYLDESRRRLAQIAERERQRLRRLRAGLVGVTLLAVVALVAVVGLVQARGAMSTARNQADDARNAALSRQAAVQATLLADRDPALAQQVALAGYRIASTAEARSALLDSSARLTPTRIPTPEGPMAVGVTADGHHLAAAGGDGSLRIVDRRARPQAIIATLPVIPAALFAVAVSPDGRHVVAGGSTGARLVSLADPAAPTIAATLIDDEKTTVYGAAWAPDGREVAVATNIGVRRWAIGGDGRPTPLPPLPGPAAWSQAVAYSPDGAVLAAGGTDAAVTLWRTGTDPELLSTTKLAEDRHFVLTLAFSPDSRTLAVGSRSKTFQLYDVADPRRPQRRAELGGFGSYASAVAFSPDGRRIAGGSPDNTTKVWDVGSREVLATLPNSAAVTGATFTDGGSVLATVTADGVIQQWPMPGPATAQLGDTVFSLVMSAERRFAAAGLGPAGGGLALWDVGDDGILNERTPRLTVSTPASLAGSATVSRDGTLVAAGDADGRVHIWNVADPVRPRPLVTGYKAVDGIVYSMAFARDNRWIAVTSSDFQTVALVDITAPGSPRTVGTINATGLVQQVNLDPSGTRLSVATAAKNVELWDVTDPAAPVKTGVLDGFAGIASVVAFHPTRPLAAVGSADRTTWLWDLTDPGAPKHVSTLRGPSSSVYSLQFSGAGTHLAAGTTDDAWIWDVGDPAEPTEYAAVKAYPGRAYDVNYGPGDMYFYVSGTGKFILRFAADADAVAAEVCAHPLGLLTAAETEQYLPGATHRDLCG